MKKNLNHLQHYNQLVPEMKITTEWPGLQNFYHQLDAQTINQHISKESPGDKNTISADATHIINNMIIRYYAHKISPVLHFSKMLLIDISTFKHYYVDPRGNCVLSLRLFHFSPKKLSAFLIFV